MVLTERANVIPLAAVDASGPQTVHTYVCPPNLSNEK